MKRGQRYVTLDGGPSRRLFIRVNRVARDGSWADITVCNWAVMWRKRQPLVEGQFAFAVEAREWDAADLVAQELAWSPPEWPPRVPA